MKERNSKHKTKGTDLDVLKLAQVTFPVLQSQGFYTVMESNTLKSRSVKESTTQFKSNKYEEFEEEKYLHYPS